MKAAKDRPILAGSGAVLGALRKRYENERGRAPTYALFTEVSNGTGGNLTSYADAIVMNLWPSRGYTISGFEIKVSRSDWTRELQNPAKCEPIFKFCDEWWIAVSDEAIVKDGELPPTWGLLVPDKKGGLRVAVKAPMKKYTPDPVSRAFLAAILRRAMQQSVDESAIATARAEGKKDAEASAATNHAYTRDELAGLRKKVTEFEHASGISLESGWHSPVKVGDAVRQILRGSNYLNDLRTLEKTAAHIHDEIKKAVTAHESAQPKPSL